MRKILLFVALCFSFAVETPAGNLHFKVIFPSFAVPTDGVNRTQSWSNDTGSTIYIKRIKILVYSGYGDREGVVNGWVRRISDGALLTYYAWSVAVETAPSGPQGSEVNEHFGNDYFELSKTDGLQMDDAANGFGGIRTNVACFIWYTLEP